jgi:DNA-binding LytR/AlgR family response regulator
MTYSCILIDDEQLALDVLENYLRRIDALELKGAFLDPVEAFNYLAFHQVELIFIDINMPELSGLELIGSLSPRPAVIIVSAYREYAVEGFELNVLDYLLKPVSFERFLRSVQRFLQSREQKGLPEGPQSITVRADRRDVRVDLEDILYVEGLKDYVRIHTAGETVITKDSIGNFCEKLPQDRFLRVHRSFVVNLSKVKSASASDLQVGDKLIPIGVTYEKAVRGKLGKGGG